MTRARSIEVVMQGARAEEAARDLFAMGWFEAEWERQRGAPGAPAVHGRVMAIAGGSVTIADKVLAWWQSWRQADSNAGAGLSLELVGPSSQRVSLDTADRDALVEVLRSLHPSAR